MSIVDLIAAGIREGLPYPGDPDTGQPPRLLIMPGMNLRGLPPELMQKFAEDAGLPSPDFPRLIAEAIVNLIETTGNSDIVARPESEAEDPPVEHVWKKFQNRGE